MRRFLRMFVVWHAHDNAIVESTKFSNLANVILYDYKISYIYIYLNNHPHHHFCCSNPKCIVCPIRIIPALRPSGHAAHPAGYKPLRPGCHGFVSMIFANVSLKITSKIHGKYCVYHCIYMCWHVFAIEKKGLLLNLGQLGSDGIGLLLPWFQWSRFGHNWWLHMMQKCQYPCVVENDMVYHFFPATGKEKDIFGQFKHDP